MLYGGNVVDAMKGFTGNEYLRWHMNEHGWMDGWIGSFSWNVYIHILDQS